MIENQEIEKNIYEEDYCFYCSSFPCKCDDINKAIDEEIERLNYNK